MAESVCCSDLLVPAGESELREADSSKAGCGLANYDQIEEPSFFSDIKTVLSKMTACSL